MEINRMNRSALVVALLGTLAWMPAAHARDDVQEFSVADALSSSEAKEALGDDIRFAFGKTSIGKVAKNHGEFRTNKKTNAFGKSDLKACNWVFLSAMISLRDRAVTEGGNAVINIRSNYKDNTTSSETSFKCGAGNVIAGVALIGDVVTLN